MCVGVDVYVDDNAGVVIGVDVDVDVNMAVNVYVDREC